MSAVAKLLLIFTLIPIAEISILIPLHTLIGGWPTFAVICCTAILGTTLTKWQGGAAIGAIKKAIAEGRLPGEEIIDGVLVLLAGATLITPGVLTDTVGLLLLVPSIRRPVTRFAKKRVMGWINVKSMDVGVPMADLHPGEQPSPTPSSRPVVSEGVIDGGNIGQPDDLL